MNAIAFPVPDPNILGRRAAIVRPQDYSMSDVVAIMTGALEVEKQNN